MKNIYAANVYKLFELLERKYGYRYKASLFKALMGNVEGTLDNKAFNINFDGEQYLVISTNLRTKDVLNELLPILKKLMKNAKPICSYDLQMEGLEEVRSTMEWDIKDPDGRLKKIINGKAFPEGFKIHNLKLYNSKKIEDYLENAEEKENNSKSARIYGVDPGCISDVEEINNLSEVDLYLAIDAMNEYIRICRYNMAQRKSSETDLMEGQYALEYMIYQTTKFGVELPEPAFGKHIVATPSYNAWYMFYAHHFKNFLTEEQRQAFLEAERKGQDTSSFMPSGNWADLLENKKSRK